MATKIEASRLLMLQAAAQKDAGERADLEAGMAKLFATETAEEVALEAMRIHGGYGYSQEFVVERIYRDAPVLILGEGSNEIQQLVIARRLLERYAGLTWTSRSPTSSTEIRAAVRDLCDGFPGEYWRALEPDRYPEEFVHALTDSGWLAALIPEEYGGAGLGLTAASVILEEINASRRQRGRLPRADVHDGHAAPARQRRAEAALPAADRRRASSGSRRSASPSRPSGSDTTRDPDHGRARSTAATSSAARRSGPRAPLHSDLMLLLARTTPLDQVEKRTRGPLGLPRRHEGRRATR